MKHATPLLTLLATALLATTAQAQQYGPRDAGRRFEDGTRVVCQRVVVRNTARDQNRIAGTAIGAVVGAAIGNQVGGGDGRRLATVGGAVAGGAVGRHVQGRQQEARGERATEMRCWRTAR